MPVTRSQTWQLQSKKGTDSSSSSSNNEGRVEPPKKRLKQGKETDEDKARGRLLHVIPPPEYKDGMKSYDSVLGLTIHGDELFVLRYADRTCIYVYDVTNFTFQRYIRLHEEIGTGWTRVMTSCDVNHCLYLGLHFRNVILRIDLTQSEKVVDDWKVDGCPVDLSVNANHNLLVTCARFNPYNLIEYTTYGRELRRIVLDCSIAEPRQAVQLNDGLFLLAHSDWSLKPEPSYDRNQLIHRVSMIGADGRIKLSFEDTDSSSTGKPLTYPSQLAVDKNGQIYVAFEGYYGTVVLDSALKRSRDLNGDENMERPSSLVMDERRGRLLVGERGRMSRILVFRL